MSGTAMAVIAGVGGLGLTTLGATAASADQVLNGPTVNLNLCLSTPSSAPAYVNDGALLPTGACTLGNPTNIFMTGSSSNNSGPNTYALTANGIWGVQTSTALFTGSSDQVWYFQRVGWVAVNTPLTVAGINELAVPVYHIINYNPVGYTCLEAVGGSNGMEPTAYSVVQTGPCNPNEWNQTNQLWVVGSPAQTNDLYYNGGLSSDQDFQWYSYDLQPNVLPNGSSNVTGLNESVIESLYSLTENNWTTYNSEVLSASQNNLPGINSGLDLQEQAFPADEDNSTFDVEAVPPPVSSGGSNPCAGLTGYNLFYCGMEQAGQEIGGGG